MNDAQDFLNRQPVKQALAALRDKVHLSSEMIVAYAHGILSPEGKIKVGSHLAECERCSAMLRIAQQAWESDGGPKAQEPDSKATPIPAKLAAKLKVASFVYSRRQELQEKMAHLFLAKEAWPSIQPILSVVQKWSPEPHEEQSENNNALPLAAFSSTASRQKKENIKWIVEIVDFVDELTPLLIERCDDLDDLERELPRCIEQAAVSLQGISLVDTVKAQVLACAKTVLCDTRQGRNEA